MFHVLGFAFQVGRLSIDGEIANEEMGEGAKPRKAIT